MLRGKEQKRKEKEALPRTAANTEHAVAIHFLH